MGKIIFINIIRFIILFVLQVAVLKNIGYYNIAVAFPYILAILLLPIGISNFTVYLAAFLMGLTIDAFYDSVGIHAAACVVIAWFRIFFLNITLEADDQNSFLTPNWGNQGFKWFITYILFATILHHFILFIIEVFSFSNLHHTLVSALLSTICTVFIIFLISLLTYKKKTRLVN